MHKAIGVLVADDSPLARRQLAALIASDPAFAVVGLAAHGAEAVAKAAELLPDVVCLDLRMPQVDGAEATRQIMASRQPRPIILVDDAEVCDGPLARAALAAGAVEFVARPAAGAEPAARAQAEAELLARLRVAARVRVVRTAGSRPLTLEPAAALLAEPRPRPPAPAGEPGEYGLIAIGSSTGGPAALKRLLGRAEFLPPVLVAQHMPAAFTRDLARQLDEQSRLRVQEAEGGEVPLPGHVYIAPGDRHLELGPDGLLRLLETPPVNYCRPSVDVLFYSVARHCQGRCLALVLTGMGQDGAAGARAVKAAGGTVVAEDESTAVVFSMPKAAIDGGAVDHVMPLDDLAAMLETLSRAACPTAVC